MNLLRALRQAGVVRAIDDALANTLRRLDPSTPDEVLASAALASLAVSNGHAAFDPAHPERIADGSDLAWPAAAAWEDALHASPWVASPETAQEAAAAAPLVFEQGLLYLRRYREYERRLALRLLALAAHHIDPSVESTDMAALFAQLFPDAARGDRQAIAAALALRRLLLLITGGPGTGKTTTIARLLVLRIAQARAGQRAPLRIALAAPTGRAADRMAASLHRAAEQMQQAGLDAALIDALPATASTLHRLLGVIPDSARFRHDGENPLPFDIIVVDEASMVDLPLMCKLAEAVADGAQLILLGDADQLPSVEAGDVLAAVLRAAGSGDMLDLTDAEALEPLLGNVPQAPLSGLQGHRVHLLRGWRQNASLDLAPLADAVREGDVEAALQLLRSGELSNVHFHPGVEDPLQAWPALQAYWRALPNCGEPGEALALANQLRLLTAVREGPQGARALNARIAALLSGSRVGAAPDWFAGRLLLITENSYRHDLFNGDVGVCLSDSSGTPVVWFPGGSEGIRGFHAAGLPAHESAFAMTVHKTQGSEFDTVWLQLPRMESRVLGRELLYTAITRARRELHVAASANILRTTIGRQVLRVSGLTHRLTRT